MPTTQERKEALQVALNELSSPQSIVDEVHAMECIKQEILCCEKDGDDGDLKRNLFTVDNVEIITRALANANLEASVEQPSDYNGMGFYPVQISHPGQYYHAACSILMMMSKESPELSRAVVSNKGIERALDIMKAYASDSFLTKSCIILAWVAVQSLADEDALSFASKYLEKFVDFMEVHFKKSGDLYSWFCLLVEGCLNRNVFLVDKLYQRMVSIAWQGITLHKNDEDAQETGRCLLCRLVGTEAASKLIDDSEMHHCERKDCSRCA